MFRPEELDPAFTSGVVDTVVGVTTGVLLTATEVPACVFGCSGVASSTAVDVDCSACTIVCSGITSPAVVAGGVVIGRGRTGVVPAVLGTAGCSAGDPADAASSRLILASILSSCSVEILVPSSSSL